MKDPLADESWVGSNESLSPDCMKAIRLENPQHFRYVDVPEPAAPAPGEALVRVHRVGICGTDYGAFLGKMPLVTYPRIPGHELGVEVLAVGAGVSHVRAGDRCAVEPYLNDPGSFASRRGHPNCCENLRVLGVQVDGGLRARFILPARKLHPTNSLSLDQAALVETFAVGAHAVARGGCVAGENVLVIGAGATGLAAAEAARILGARVLVMDANASRLELVKSRFGVKDAILSKGDDKDVEELDRLTGGHLANCVIEATGNSRTIGMAGRFVGFAGRLVLMGFNGGDLAFGHTLLHRRELSVLASRNALPEDFGRVVGWLEAGRIDTRSWLTHSAGFGEMVGEFAKWLNPDIGVVKAVVRVDG